MQTDEPDEPDEPPSPATTTGIQWALPRPPLAATATTSVGLPHPPSRKSPGRVDFDARPIPPAVKKRVDVMLDR